MRIAAPLLALVVAIPALAQEAPKQSPFAFEMPKKAEPAKPKAEAKPEKKSETKSEGKAETKSEPKSDAPAPAAVVAPEPQTVSSETVAPEPMRTKEVGSESIAAPAEAAGPQAPVAAPVAATPVAPKPAHATSPDPLNFRLPNTEQAPAKGNPDQQKSNPFTFELPQPKSDAPPKS